MAKKNVKRPEFIAFEENRTRQCFMYAVEALSIFRNHQSDDFSQSLGVRAIIDALKRVHESGREFRIEWDRTHPDHDRYREMFLIDEVSIVATALWHVTEGRALGPEEVGIPCVGATPLICFARAAVLAELAMELTARIEECNQGDSLIYVDDDGAGVIMTRLSSD